MDGEDAYLKLTSSEAFGNNNGLPEILKCPVTYEDRLSTFDSWPQHVFPSAANNLRYELEKPFAFSHHVPAFFWTREDALTAIQWNIHARPPCLNCVVSGEIHAKLCDRLARQERYRGTIRCCHRCEELGMEEGCIEMIELHIDWPEDRELTAARLDPADLVHGCDRLRRTENSWVDQRIWTKEERVRRAKGKTIWRPINLHYGDAKGKEAVVAKWQSGRGREIARTDFSASASKPSLQLARRQVQQWDNEIREERSDSRNTSRSTSDEPVPRPESNASQPASETVSNIDSFEHWSSLLLSRRTDLYHENLKSYGRAKANRTDQDFERVCLDLLAHVRSFLARRLMLRKGGCLDEEAHDKAVHELPEEAKTWIHELIPGLLQYGTSAS